ncbi:MAG: hypothetical protein HY722_04555 [Planctomycetes bacterium]|nr:hypothetical protein [Planctomycetota bacterium]
MEEMRLVAVPPPPGSCTARRLTRHERRVLEAVAEAFIPSGGALGHPAGAAEAGVAGRVERFFLDAPAAHWWGLRAALCAVDLLAIGWSDPPATLKNLTPRGRERVLVALGHHPFYPVRQLFFFLKLMCCMQYYEHPEVAAHLGATWPCARPEGDPS